MVFIDLFFPKFCFGCATPGTYLCVSCQKKLVFADYDICFYCKKASYLGFTHPGCKRQFGVDGFLAVCLYNSLLKRIIKTIKYRLAKEVLTDLLNIIITPAVIQKLKFYQRKDSQLFLQPVPLHVKRKRIRGFNQAELIAKNIGKHLNTPLVDLIIRRINTLAQAQLSRGRDRYFNIQGAFSLKNSKKTIQADILLIDDVVTSGATIREATRVLKKQIKGKVFVFALAKG